MLCVPGCSIEAAHRYGFLNHFRPLPLMPNQVYRLDPETRAVRVVADGFDRCNGIAFSRDGKTAFVCVRMLSCALTEGLT